MTVTAIIPARAGSKAIPHKNMQELGGLPLVLHSVFHALDAELVDRVIVSTDDPDVVSVCADLPCEVHPRPPELATDEATTDSVLLHHCVTDRSISVVVLLQPTSPFRTPADVDACVHYVTRQGYASAFTACQVPFTWRGAGPGMKPNHYDPRDRPNRQSAPLEWVENGAAYATTREAMCLSRYRMPGPLAIQEMPWLESLQIDEPADLEAARALWKALR